MFRRKQTPEAPAPTKPGGKGRPTPTRREAEAAARAAAKAPRTRKEIAAAERAARTENSGRIRQALKTGDERYLPTRDRGPVRRFIRDFVDSRISFVELMLPILLITIVLGYSGSVRLVTFANSLLMVTLVLVLIDLIVLRFRVRREVQRRFPDESQSGVTWYALTRAMQMKFMRLPKAQVKIGQKLPESYR